MISHGLDLAISVEIESFWASVRNTEQLQFISLKLLTWNIVSRSSKKIYIDTNGEHSALATEKLLTTEKLQEKSNHHIIQRSFRKVQGSSNSCR